MSESFKANFANIMIALISLLGSAFISYMVTQTIEKPRLEVEIQKSKISGLQLAQEIRPILSIKCFHSTLVRGFSWEIGCEVVNDGKYISEISIPEIRVVYASKFDPKQHRISEHEAVNVVSIIHPEGEHAVRLSPGQSTIFTHTVHVNKERYQSGVDGSYIGISEQFTAEVIPDIIRKFEEILPDFASLIEKLKSSSRTYTQLLDNAP